LKKRFGQHFLTDPSILRRIVEFAHINPQNSVVEIGPGAGALTAELAKAAARVIAMEIDADLIAGLRSSMPSNVEVVHGDALEMPWPPGMFHVVGNLPYNVATPLLKRFIDDRESICDVTVMVQKEVAERLVSKPGTREYGPLSVLVQYYATVKYGFKVSPGSFRPRPKVDSAIVRLEWKPDVAAARPFTDFVQHAFGSRRKKLVNNLLSMFGSLGRIEIEKRINAADISPDCRPEQLSVAEFLRLYHHFK
jgi:16S rRNA (adenine1518-N6/adenine1519-N6)-dimethyltransferase